MNSTVWLLTRPLTYTSLFPPLANSSAGKDHLRHWGILISEMTIVDAQAIMLRTRGYGGNDDLELGTLYELFRNENDYNNVNIICPFGMRTIKENWHGFSIQYVGETQMTHDMIEQEGTSFRSQIKFQTDAILAIRITHERPNYCLFVNNCPNFVKFLLEVVCPDASIPETIKCVFDRMLDISVIASMPDFSLPGAYPPSIAATTCDSFKTTAGRTWVTASGTTWITAAECFSIAVSSSSTYYTESLNPRASRKAKVNLRLTNQVINAVRIRFRGGKGALHRAVLQSDEKRVRALLNLNADVLARDDEGRTAPTFGR